MILSSLNRSNPNHFILGCHHPHLPPNVEDAFPCASRKHWEQAQFIVDQFWRRWMREYVPELIERKKWNKKTREMRLGDRVLVLDENHRRGLWVVATVTKLFHGDGGVVRKVLVKPPNLNLFALLYNYAWFQMLNRRVWSVAHQRQSWRSGNLAIWQIKRSRKKKGAGEGEETKGVRDIHALFGVHLCS